MKKILLYGLGIILTIAFIFVISTFGTIDMTPYKEMPYYQQSLQYLDSVSQATQNTRNSTAEFRVGWAKKSVLPPKAIPLAGYGDREGALSEGIRDSIWIRVIVIDNGNQKFAMVSGDLLIIPLQVTKRLESSLVDIGFSLGNTYLTATHTHCGPGAWDPSYVGEMFGGPYDVEVVELIEQQILSAIQEAEQDLLPTKVGYGEISAPEYVYNRLVREEGIEDPYFRMLKFERADSTSALWMTYAAHATCLSGDERRFSQDYPGKLVELMEKNTDIDFAVYAAGAVGSHGPEGGGQNDSLQINFMAEGLFEKANERLDSVEMTTPNTVSMLRTRIFLRDPHVRINEDVRLSNFVFEQLLGDFPAYISGLRIGNTLLLGTPCDFSGELVPELEAQGLKLMVTSFNGGYIGYITKDKWYELDSYETRTMNWFGPYNGAYFVEMMNKIIEQMSE